VSANLQAALAAATRRLQDAGVPSPSYDARALAVHVLGLRRPSDLLAVDEIDEDRYTELVGKRAERVPLQHLVGSVGFRHLELDVGPGVFIPRPESELVAGAVIDHLRALHPARDPHPDSRAGTGERGSPIVVELCAGSGAIALSVAQEVPGAVVHAVELDPGAMEWARRNDPSGSVTWHLGSIEGCLPELDGQVDVVVSNPPYVPVGDPVERETEHDPQVALWGGADGLDVVRMVEVAARRLLKPGGLVVVEHDVTQGESAPAVFEGWADVADHDDLTGRPRFLTARWSR
jgi:release factor glutamine methyltransferase